MKTRKLYPVLLIIPLFILGWGFFNLYFFDTFYSRSTDPEYPYLINGLNVAILKFKQIGHFDHPGTPFQVFCGIIIRITHLFTGKDSIVDDVFKRPDYYLNAISFSLILLQAGLTWFIGWIGKKRGIITWRLVILQSMVLFNMHLLWIFSRVIPDRWLVIVALLYIIVYLLYGYNHKHPLKFALWSGIIMGMGLATKVTFLPILFLPFLLIDTNKNRLIYTGSGILSFFFFLLPIIGKWGTHRRFLTGIATHDGIYGQGAERMFDPVRTKENFLRIFDAAPELKFLIIAIAVVLILAIIYRKKQGTNRNIVLFTGMLFILSLQIVMVAKHFNAHYLVPMFSIYPLFLFLLDDFIFKTGSCKKWTYLPVILLFITFTGFTAQRTVDYLKPIKGEMAQREEMRLYVSEHIPSNAYWFVEPTWENAPYVENGIYYGLCYCHRRQNYIPVLTNTYPNTIIYGVTEEHSKIWNTIPVCFDSLVTTATPVYVYSTSGRNAEKLIKILEAAAERNQAILTMDTVYSNENLNSHIILVKNGE
jgi:hypothetical protein